MLRLRQRLWRRLPPVSGINRTVGSDCATGPQNKKAAGCLPLETLHILLANIVARKGYWPNGEKVRLGGASVPLHSRSEKLGSNRLLQAVRFKRRKSFEVR